MLNVFITVDTEIWCGSWENLDQTFPAAFDNYVYGKTKKGEYGIPFQLQILKNYGLNAVYFVEPLFSGKFGRHYLKEIVELIQDADQEVQMHLHTEWVDECVESVLPYKVNEKKQFLRCFSVKDQELLLRKGLEWLDEAGSKSINAFRAGSFGLNRDTFPALKAAGIKIDSSYNITMSHNSEIDASLFDDGPVGHEGIIEYPMTVYEDRPGHLRHVQLAACSFNEIEGLLWKSLELGRNSLVLLSHNFELFDPKTMRANKINISRYEKLCNFLDKNRSSFNTSTFKNTIIDDKNLNNDRLKSPLWKTGLRMVEQLMSRAV